MDSVRDTIIRWVYELDGLVNSGSGNSAHADQLRGWLFGAAQVVLLLGHHDLYDKAMEAYRT